MRIAATIVLFGLAACNSAGVQPSPAPVYPSSPYWRMIPGTFAEFDCQQGTAVYDAVARTITLTGPLTDLGPFRITNLAYLNAGVPAIARTLGKSSVEIDTVPPDMSGVLLEEIQSIGPTLWIGEAGGQYGFQTWPPEPELAVVPTPGQQINVQSTVLPGPGNPTFQFSTQYWTEVVTPTEATTTLIEAPTGIGQLGVYQFDFDGELKQLEYGAMSVDGSIPVLTVYTRLSEGSNGQK